MASWLLCDTLRLLVFQAVVGLVLTQDDWHFRGANVALGKPTYQFPGTYNGLLSSNAIDGDPDICAHTQRTSDTPLFWSVDLGGSYMIKGVRVYNRRDVFARYRVWNRNFTVIGYPGETIVYDDSKAQPEQYMQRVITIPVTDITPFTNITFKLPAGTIDVAGPTKYLSICEVEIYSVAGTCDIPQTGRRLNWNLQPGTGYVYTEIGRVASGSVIDLFCDTNYNLTGKSNITCLSNGTYNDDIPECYEIRCKVPALITNGAYQHTPDMTSYAVGETVSWECTEGYKSAQDKIRTCQVTGTWTGDDPVCSLITCPYPNKPSRAALHFTNGSVYDTGNARSKEEITVKCEEGFKPGASTIVCKLDESWDNMPTCSQVTCARLPCYTYKYNNKTIAGTSQTFVYGTAATVECSEGFISTGTERKCVDDGTWSGDHRCGLHDQSSSPEALTTTMAVTAGVGCGTFVVGIIVGYVAATVVAKWRKGRVKRPTTTEAVYCTPTISPTEDTHNYEQLQVATNI